MATKKLYEVNANEEVSRPADFALNASGAPTETYVSSLFSSDNTSLDAANINYTATGETATTVKAKIQAIETQVGTAASSLTTALGTAAS